MAAPSVTFDGVRIDDADDEAVTTFGVWDKWDSSQSPSNEPDFVYQGDGSISNKVGTSEDGIELESIVTSIDFAGGGAGGADRVALLKVIATNYAALNAQGSTGLILYIGSGTTTDRYLHYFHGNDTYPIAGGWVFGLWDPNIAAYQSATQGTPNLNAVTYIAVSATFSATSKSENLAIDAIDYFDVGSGLTLIGGDGVSADAVFDDFVSFDEGTLANRYGIVRTVEGILYVAGFLTVGSATETDFTDATGGTMVFPDGPFGPGTVGLRVSLANASSVFDCSGWSFVGRGSVTGADSRPDYEFTGTSGAGSYTACAFRNFRNWTLTTAGDLIDCILADGLLITQAGGTLDGCAISGFTGVTGGHYILATNPTEIKNNVFTSSGAGHAVRCDTIGTYDWTGNTDSGYTGTRGTNLVSSSGSNDAMFYNNSGGLITLNVDATGQSPSVRNGAGATTQVNQVVTLTATVVDEANVPVPYASVSIQDQSDDSEISAGIANNLGVYTDTGYSYTVDVDVNVVARKSSPGAPRYRAVSSPNTITSSGLNAGVGLAADPNAGLLPMVGVLRHGVQSEDLNDATVTATVALPAGTSRKLVAVGMYWGHGADLTVSAATYDGNAMTAEIAAGGFTGPYQELFMYQHNIPDGDEGVKVISFTFSAAVNIKAIAFAVLDDVNTGAAEDAAGVAALAATSNPTISLDNTTADAFTVAVALTDDLDSPSATGVAENRVRRSDVVRDAAAQSVTILVADRASAGVHSIGADFGANTKTWLIAGATFAKN